MRVRRRVGADVAAATSAVSGSAPERARCRWRALQFGPGRRASPRASGRASGMPTRAAMNAEVERAGVALQGDVEAESVLDDRHRPVGLETGSGEVQRHVGPGHVGDRRGWRSAECGRRATCGHTGSAAADSSQGRPSDGKSVGIRPLSCRVTSFAALRRRLNGAQPLDRIGEVSWPATASVIVASVVASVLPASRSDTGIATTSDFAGTPPRVLR